jgi:hypothetical protein
MRRQDPAVLVVLAGLLLVVAIAVAAWRTTDDLPLPGNAAFYAIGGGLFVIACLVALFVWLQSRNRRSETPLE